MSEIALTGAVILGILALSVFLFLFGAFVLYLVASKLFKIKKATFGRAIIAHIVGLILAGILGFTLGRLPLIGPLITLLGFIVNIWTIKHFFQIKSWMTSILIWLVAYFITFIVALLFVVVVFIVLLGMTIANLAPFS